MRLAIVSAAGLWIGATLLLSQVRWFARPPLTDRLVPYVPGGLRHRPRTGLLSLESFAEVIGPLARAIGARFSRAVGVSEELAIRLERVHSPLDVTTFRVRQLGWSVAGFGIGALLMAALRPPLAVALIVMASGPLLAFLILEQQLARASDQWKRRLFLELPVVTEQLAMLLSAGYSLGASLNRLATRSHGCFGRDVARVCRRIRQGVSEIDALREWARVANVQAVDRLVPVLALNREASDLGRLLSQEARSIRTDVHRMLIETVERRAQQVWIPVTVAALVPGVIFLSIPFIEALRLYSTS